MSIADDIIKEQLERRQQQTQQGGQPDMMSIADEIIAEQRSGQAQLNTPAPEPPESVFGKFIGVVKDIGKGVAQATVKTGLSIGQMVNEAPNVVTSKPWEYKEKEPANLHMSIFGKDITSVQRSAFERNIALQKGEITKRQALGAAGEDILDLATFVPIGAGASVVAKGATQTLKQAAKIAAKEGVKYGAGFGGAYGATGAMKENKNFLDILKDSAVGAGVGAAAGVTLGVGGAVVGKAAGKMLGKKNQAPNAFIEEIDAVGGKAARKSENTFMQGVEKVQGGAKPTMADIVTKNEQKVNLRPEIEAKGRFMEDIKRVQEVQKPVETPQIRKMIEDSGFIDLKEADTKSLAALEGKKAQGKSRYNFNTQRGEIVIAKDAQPSSVAHEFAHPVNYKLGEGKDKFSNQLNKYVNGQTDQIPKAVMDYTRSLLGKGVPESEIMSKAGELAKTISNEIKGAARLDPKVEFRLTNASEEFATAFSNALVRAKEAEQVAPEFVKFVTESVAKKSKALPEKTIAAEVKATQKKVDQVAVAKEVKQEISYPVKEPEKGVKVFARIKDGVAKIDSIEISKAKQGKGLGKKYVQEFEKWARDNGAKKIEIDAYKKSTGFWEKQGFKLEKEFPIENGVKQDYKYGVKDLAPEAKKKNKLTIIDPDALKKEAGDFNPKNHEKYSAQAKENYKKALAENTNETVKFTAGGSGSGKSELILDAISKDFDGIIVDGTLADFGSAVKKINQAEAAGKKVEIYAILPRIESAWKFVQKRELKTGRGVPLKDFIEKHVGFVRTLRKLLEEGYPVFLKDTREIYSKTEAKWMPFIENRKVLIDKLKKVEYSEIELERKLQNVKISEKSKRKTLREIENKRRGIQPESQGAKPQGKGGQKPVQEKSRLDEGIRANQGLKSVQKTEAIKPSQTNDGFNFAEKFRQEQPSLTIRPEVINETKKTVRVKTPSAITQGGAVKENIKPIKSPSILTEKLNTADDVKGLIEKVAKADQEMIDRQRRGKITNKELEELSEMTGIKAKDILEAKAGSILNAENALATRKIMLNAANELSDYVATIGAKPTPNQLATFRQLFNRFRGLQRSLAGFRSEAGRLLQSFSMEVVPNEYEMMDDLIKKIAEIDQSGADEITKALKVGKEIKPDNLYQLAIKAGVETNTAFLLYNPPTHVANILGNAAKAILRPAEKFFGEKISSAAKYEKGIVKGEAGAHWQGMKDAAPEAWTKLKEDFKEIFKGGEISGFHTKAEEVSRDRKTYEFLRKIGTPEKAAELADSWIKTSFKLLTASDNYFRTINSGGELYSQALRKGTQEGLTGKALQKRIMDLMENPMQDDEFLKAINKEVDTLLFQEDLPQGVKKLMGFREEYPATKFIMFFTKTPFNIAREAIRTSPLGFLRPAFNKMRGKEMEQASKALAYAQASMGTALAGMTLMSVASGRITGSAPSDRGKRDEFYASGKQPYSFRVGNKWISYRRLEPFATIIAMTANTYETITDDEIESKGVTIAKLYYNNITDQTFMKGIFDLNNAINDPNRYGDSWLYSQLTNKVPSFVGHTARSIDPTVREVNSLADAFKAIIPEASKSLPAKVDIFGREVKREGGFLTNFFTPFKVATDKNDKTAQELEKSGYDVSTSRLDEIRGVKIEGKAKEIWLKAVGQATKKELDRLVASSYFQNFDQAEKDKAIKKTVEEVRDRYRQRVASGELKYLLDKRSKMTSQEKKAYDEQLKGKLAEKLRITNLQ